MGKLSHRAATETVSSRAGICPENLRGSRVLSLQLQTPPALGNLLGDLGTAPEVLWSNQSCSRAKDVTVFEEWGRQVGFGRAETREEGHAFQPGVGRAPKVDSSGASWPHPCACGEAQPLVSKSSPPKMQVDGGSCGFAQWLPRQPELTLLWAHSV